VSETYDALILGAGPAGATAALTLARKGLRARKARCNWFHCRCGATIARLQRLCFQRFPTAERC